MSKIKLMLSNSCYTVFHKSDLKLELLFANEESKLGFKGGHCVRSNVRKQKKATSDMKFFVIQAEKAQVGNLYMN